MERWSLVNPGLLADRAFSLPCPGFALRVGSFNSGPVFPARAGRVSVRLLALPLRSHPKV